MTHLFSDSPSEYLATSLAAIKAGGPVLENLGWAELLPHLDQDPECRKAVYALFRAQGQTLTTTGALGQLMAHPYRPLLQSDPAPLTATIERPSHRRGVHVVVSGAPRAGFILVDRPGAGVWLVDSRTVELRPIQLAGGLDLHAIELEPARSDPALSEPEARAARQRSTFLGRIALAFDMLGAAETALETAVGYATHRQQFSEPIGRFQAIRHLLARASVDCAATEAVAEQASQLDLLASPRYDAVVKAVAGRNTRRVCEKALQTLGAIGFMVEHSHHRYHSRILALDSLLGSSTQLVASLAAECRVAGGADPALDPALLDLTA